jgi:threonine dehydratase
VISLERIEEAARVIDPVFLHTPQFVDEALSQRLDMRVILKVELVNPIRSFKGRGADYFLYQLAGRPNRLIAASAGNFGQGLAYAARRWQVPVTIFAAHTANPLKVERMRLLGAEVHLAGDDFDAAKAAAREYAAQLSTGSLQATFVEDGAEPAIAEGAGSIAVELSRWPDPIDDVLIPVGNGALITGMGRWLKAVTPMTRVTGVCAAGAPAMERSWRSGHAIFTDQVNTVADGIAVRVPIPQAVDDMRETVDDVVLVDDKGIIDAMRLLFETLGLVVEPAGAAGLAACLNQRDRLRGMTVAVPLCGGNLSAEQARRWLSCVTPATINASDTT